MGGIFSSTVSYELYYNSETGHYENEKLITVNEANYEYFYTTDSEHIFSIKYKSKEDIKLTLKTRSNDAEKRIDELIKRFNVNMRPMLLKRKETV